MQKTTNTFRVLVKKLVTKQALGGPRRRLDDNTNIFEKALCTPSHLLLRAAKGCSVISPKIPNVQFYLGRLTK